VPSPVPQGGVESEVARQLLRAHEKLQLQGSEQVRCSLSAPSSRSGPLFGLVCGSLCTLPASGLSVLSVWFV
jgi:hypothetical protein